MSQILLCDMCDSGYHTACLRPPLMVIPDGEWFCPPCQHVRDSVSVSMPCVCMWAVFMKYIGGKNDLIPCWFCMFAHWHRNDQSIILMVGLFEQWETEIQLQETSDLCDCRQGFCHQVLSHVLWRRQILRLIKMQINL